MPPKPQTVKLLLELGAKPNDELIAQMEAENEDDPASRDIARMLKAAMPQAVTARSAPGNLDDAAYGRMRAAAGMPMEKQLPISDLETPLAQGPARPDDFALVVGVEEYQSLPKADYGARDAKTVRRYLEALGLPARNIASLEGSGATKSKLESSLQEWLPVNVKHGAKSGDAFLVP